MKSFTIRAAILVVLMMVQTSCVDQDPFGLNTRVIQGEYELEQWEDGSTYHLKGPSALKHQAWGAIEGTVGRIGWSGDTILVWQNDGGSGEGWRIIDTRNKVISPLVSQERVDQDPNLKRITIHTAAEAWEKLDSFNDSRGR